MAKGNAQHYAAIRVYLLLLAVAEGDVNLDAMLVDWAYKWLEDMKYSETVWLEARTDHESFMREWIRDAKGRRHPGRSEGE